MSKYVSNCCGAAYVESIDFENDIETTEMYVCNECQDYCDIIEDYEYSEQMKEARDEDRADEERDMGRG